MLYQPNNKKCFLCNPNKHFSLKALTFIEMESTGVNYLHQSQELIKGLQQPHRNNYRDALAESCSCNAGHVGQLLTPDIRSVKRAEEIEAGINDLSLIKFKIILTTSMAREYVSFLAGKEITKAAFEARVNKGRHRDLFGVNPSAGAKQTNLYSYGSVFILWGVSPTDMPAVSLNF